MEKMKHIFLNFDEDQNGVLTIEEVNSALSSIDKNGDGIVDAGELAETFHAAGLEQQDLKDLLSYFAVFNQSKMNDKQEIDYSTFINGLFSMYNPSTRKDTLEILSEVKNSMKQTQNCDARLTDMELAIGALDKKIEITIGTQNCDARLTNMESSIQALDKKMDLMLEQLQNDSRGT